MRRLFRTKARAILSIVFLGAASLVIAGFLFAWSGLYNIAASRGHWAIVEWALEFGMSNSVKRRAAGIAVPPLDSADLVSLGAGHFHRACAHCHGAPGIQADLTAQRALPPPPALTNAAKEWDAAELFWIVKHGIKYTGMPAWVAQERDDEVWALVAFLKRMPTIDPATYRKLAVGTAEVPPQSGRDVASLGLSDIAVGACARCHGADQRGPSSDLVPVLHGQPAEFLARALTTYAKGTRASGFMQPVALELSSNTIAQLADYYAGLALPSPRPAPSTTGEILTAGQALAMGAETGARIPTCNGCHDRSAIPIYPRLAGQNASYMINRLTLWKNGLAPTTDTETIMAPIARLLTDEQIVAVSQYYASIAPDGERSR